MSVKGEMTMDKFLATLYFGLMIGACIQWKDQPPTPVTAHSWEDVIMVILFTTIVPGFLGYLLGRKEK